MNIAAPSAIVAAIQDTGRDAILRGSGTSESKFLTPYDRTNTNKGYQGASVCILETYSITATDKVKGLVRMVQVAPSLTLFDLTVRGLTPGKYWATIRATGDISKGVISSGGIWPETFKEDSSTPKGRLGTFTIGLNGMGSVFFDKPIRIWEMIGRSLVVSKQHDGETKFEKNDEDTLVGVIARSPGVWDNEKTICSCSGKTLWEERKDEVKKGML